MPAPATATSVSPIESAELISIFYVTNRQPSETTAPKEYYGGDRGQLRFGVCTVQFSPIPVLHQFSGNAPFYVPAEFQKVTATQELSTAQFWNQLTDAIARAKTHTPMVYLHGYDMRFEKSCRRALVFKRAVGVGDNLVLFSWPSDGQIFAYTRDEADLIWSVPHIQVFLESLVNRIGAGNAHLIGHSLGARGLVDALDQMAPDNRDLPLFDQLVLVAPDIDAGIFRRQLPDLTPLFKGITLYVSKNDNALKISRRIHGYPRLGEAGSNLTVLNGVETIDLSETGTYEISGHRYHQLNPLVSADIKRLLLNGESASQRPGLKRRTDGELIYWEIIPPAEKKGKQLRTKPSAQMLRQR